MKATLLFALSVGVSAHASDSAPQFIFNGTQSAFSFDFNTEERHTLYRTEYYEDTCYRTEQTGTRESCSKRAPGLSLELLEEKNCSDTSEQVCRTDSSGQQHCTTITARRCDHDSGGGGSSGGSDSGSGSGSGSTVTCTTVPVYEQVPYSCTQSRQVPYGTELDYNVHVRAGVRFFAVPTGIEVNDAFRIDTHSSAARIRLISRASNLLYAVRYVDAADVTRPDLGPTSPGQKEIVMEAQVQPIDLREIAAPFSKGVNEISHADGNVSFVIGRVTHPTFLSVRLKLERRRKLIGYKEIYSDKLNADQYRFEDFDRNGEKLTRVITPLSGLTLSEELNKKSKLRISAAVKLAIPEGLELLNRNTLVDDEAFGGPQRRQQQQQQQERSPRPRRS